MRVTLIHNPVAGCEEQPTADELKSLIRAAGHEVVYKSCKDLDWTRALDDPGDLVAVAGGDGTAGIAVKASDLSVQRRYSLPFGGPRGTAPTSWPGENRRPSATSSQAIRCSTPRRGRARSRPR